MEEERKRLSKIRKKDSKASRLSKISKDSSPSKLGGEVLSASSSKD